MIKLCNNCKWATQNKSSTWELRCMHLDVNKDNAYALSRVEYTGTDTLEARRNNSWFSGCGMKGKLWEQKSDLAS